VRGETDKREREEKDKANGFEVKQVMSLGEG
jgi:hypothetical protein